MAEEPETSKSALGILTHKVGPLPVVAWVAGGAAAIFLFMRLRGKSATNASTQAVGATSATGATDMSTYSGQLLDTLQSLDQRFANEQSAGPGPTVGPTTPSVVSANGPSTGAAVHIIPSAADQAAALYQQILGRQGDTLGLQNLTYQIQTQGIQAAQSGLAQSPEALAHDITTAYQNYLGRSPTSQEIQIWMPNFQRNAIQAATDIAGSPEAQAYAMPRSATSLSSPSQSVAPGGNLNGVPIGG